MMIGRQREVKRESKNKVYKRGRKVERMKNMGGTDYHLCRREGTVYLQGPLRPSQGCLARDTDLRME